jgi:hypothetical protein
MANITFILGNGFDLNLGLNTRYTDFYPEYLEMDVNDSDVENKDALIHFKELLRSEEGEWENWSDFEEAIGIFSKDFEKAEYLIDCVDDFSVNFMKRLESIENNITFPQKDRFEKLLKPTIISLVDFYSLFNRGTRSKLGESYNYLDSPNSIEENINILQFNYTKFFDVALEILNKYIDDLRENYQEMTENNTDYENKIDNFLLTNLKLLDNIHLHGTILEYPVIGVDDIDQIRNEDFHKSPDINTLLIKQKYINNISIKTDFDFNFNQRKAREIIYNSDLIIVFGASIGCTDRTWWIEIGQWIKENMNHKLIIVTTTKNRNKNASKMKQIRELNHTDELENEYRERFYKLAMWGHDDKTKYKESILFEFNTNFFNLEVQENIFAPIDKINKHS